MLLGCQAEHVLHKTLAEIPPNVKIDYHVVLHIEDICTPVFIVVTNILDQPWCSSMNGHVKKWGINTHRLPLSHRNEIFHLQQHE